MNSRKRSSSMVSQLEQLAADAYGSQDRNQRDRAAAELLRLFSDQTAIQPSIELLQGAKTVYGQTLGVNALLRLLPRYSGTMAEEEKRDLRNMILQSLTAESLLPSIEKQMVALFATITKLVDLVESTCKASLYMIQQPSLERIGLCILTQLIETVSHRCANESLQHHAEAYTELQSSCLVPIFSTIIQNLVSTSHIHDALRLLVQCLSMRESPGHDETKDTMTNIRYHDRWRSIMGAPAVLDVLLAAVLNTDETVLGIEAMTYLAAARQSLFTEQGLLQHHTIQLMDACITIMKERDRVLTSSESCTAFARMLLAFKSTYRIDQLGPLSSYSEWIRAVTQWTEHALQHWDEVGDSVHYLLSLWAQFTYALGYSKPEYINEVAAIVPQVAQAYIQTRMACLHRAMEEKDLASFFDDAAMQEHVHQLPVLARKRYPAFASFLIEQVDPLLQQMQTCLPESSEMEAVQCQLAWWAHIMDAILSVYSSSKDDIPYDALLLHRAIQIVLVSGQRKRVRVTETAMYLDRAILGLFSSLLQNVVLLSKPTAVFKPLFISLYGQEEADAMETEQDAFVVQLLDIMVHKLVNVLQEYETDTVTLHTTLEILENMIREHASRPLLFQCCSSSLMLTAQETVPLLRQTTMAMFKLRTTFYYVWGSLAFHQGLAFPQLMEPFTQRLQHLDSAPAIIALFRDLRGLVAASEAESYDALFAWFIPHGFTTIQSLLQQYATNTSITVPILRFLSEFVYNHHNRIQFAPVSTNGIVLFRSTSSILAQYSAMIQQIRVDDHVQLYETKLKVVHVCMLIVDRLVSGGYCPFGALVLYGDAALDTAIEAMFAMLCSVPIEEMLAYGKIKHTLYSMIQNLAFQCPPALASLSPSHFDAMLSALLRGCRDTEQRIQVLAADAASKLIGYAGAAPLRALGMAPPTDSDARLACLLQSESSSATLTLIWTTLFQTALQKLESTVSIAPCLVSLSLFQRPLVTAALDAFIGTQPEEARQALASAFGPMFAQMDQEKHVTTHECRRRLAAAMTTALRQVEGVCV